MTGRSDTPTRRWTLLIGPGGIGASPGVRPGFEGVERVVTREDRIIEADVQAAMDRMRGVNRDVVRREAERILGAVLGATGR